MKKILSVALVLCLVLALVPMAFADNPVVKIGVFEPQSGDNGAGGKQEILGMQYANKLTPTVEIDGVEYDVQLVYADNASSNDKAPTAAQDLISNGVSLVLGSYGSGVSIAASDTFANAGVPAIGVTCTNPQVTADCEVYFRICFLDPFQGTVLANFAKNELGASKAYCLAKLGDDYSGGLCNFFIDAFGKDNCVYEQFPEGTSDFSTYITNAQNQGCDVFFSPVSTEAAAQIIAKADTQALGMPILAGDTWDSNVILNAAKGTDVQICVTTFYQEGADEAFDKGIKEWINSDATALANNGGNDELAFSFLDVLGNEKINERVEPFSKLRRHLPFADVFGDGFHFAAFMAQFGYVKRVGQKAHVYHQVGVERQAILESKRAQIGRAHV